jgi:membrane peptidoglycan carboxypeptidase
MNPIKPQRTKTVKHLAKQIALAFFDMFLLVLTLAFAFFVYMYFVTPIAAALLKRTVPLTTIIYDRTGEHVLYEIHGEERGKPENNFARRDSRNRKDCHSRR